MKTLRLDVAEVALIVLFAVVGTSVLLPRSAGNARAPHMIEQDLLSSLERRFGVERYSQGHEEWLIRDFFDDRRGGVFLDVGAFDPIRYSNTYRLERDLGWTGVAIDALEEFSAPYSMSRPGTRFFTAFVGDRDEGQATLHVDPEQALVASGDSDFTAEFTSKAVPRQVRRRTLDSVLREAGVSRIDFVSLDIELGEPDALRAFSLETYKPQLLCVEAHGKTRQEILDIFARAGYVIVGRYLRVDHANLYFTPLSPPGVPKSPTSPPATR